MFQMYFELADEAAKSPAPAQVDDDESCHDNEANVKIREMDINDLFITQVGKDNFYKQIRKCNLTEDDHEDQ